MLVAFWPLNKNEGSFSRRPKAGTDRRNCIPLGGGRKDFFSSLFLSHNKMLKKLRRAAIESVRKKGFIQF